MITRLHGRSSTLVANPRRKRRNPKAARPRRPRTPRAPVESIESIESMYESGPNVKHGPSMAAGMTARLYRDQTRIKKLQAAFRAAKQRAGAPKSGRAKTAHQKAVAAVLKKLPKDSRALTYLLREKFTDDKGKSRRRFASSRKIGDHKPTFTVYTRGAGKEKEYGIVKNPKRKAHKRHNPYALSSRRHAKRRRNPDLMGYQLAGEPVAPMAIGGVAGIAVAAIIEGFLTKKGADGKAMIDSLPGMTPDATTHKAWAVEYHIDKALAPALVAAAAAFAYTKVSGQGKDIAKYAFLGSAYSVLEALVGGKIRDTIAGTPVPPATEEPSTTKAGELKDDKTAYKIGDIGRDNKKVMSGMYVNAFGGKPGVGGMYARLNGMSGAYMDAHGSVGADMGSLGLTKGRSIYG